MQPAVLQLDYLPARELRRHARSWWQGVLGVVGFDGVPHLDGTPVPVGWSVTPSLGTQAEHYEVWRVAGATHADPDAGNGRRGEIEFRYRRGLLFGALTVDESRFPGSRAAVLERAVTGAYRNIFRVLESTDHPHLLRVWNTLPDINAAVDGDERYRHFNAARQAAFREAGRSTVGTVPAASALGSAPGSPISIYFLASNRAPTAIENPRQTSAYHYPRQFGRHSPTFSRASLLRHADGVTLFVSGTASILGHESVHRGDIAAQTREALQNIEAVLGEANRRHDAARVSLGDLKFKVYLRSRADRPEVGRTLSAALPASTAVVYLRADVCREELLVEIEAVGDGRPHAARGP
jgi:enamine deaminase RidA (YjgF/YER057c/UK114 family)